ncbi:MAG: transposase, partial [Waddliaceae bacterium]
MAKPEKIELDPNRVEALLSRIEQQQLEECDYPLFADLVHSFGWMSKELEEKSLTIRLLRKIFGFKTERTSHLNNHTGESTNGDKESEANGTEGENSKKKKRNGKRWSSEDYKNAIITKLAHHSLKKGDRCPGCKNGNLRLIDPGKVLRIIGQPWLQAHIYERERLRCNTCGKTFTAKLPEDAARAPKYDKTAKAIVCLLKYRGGFPFYRQENLQTMLETPISDNVLWEMTRDVAICLEPVRDSLVTDASKGDCIHNDDTKARVLDLIRENKNQTDAKARTGIFTSAILSGFPDKQIALFFTGRQHAGENLNDVLSKRPKEMPTPTQMCDASNNNRPKYHETDEANCLAHL